MSTKDSMRSVLIHIDLFSITDLSWLVRHRFWKFYFHTFDDRCHSILNNSQTNTKWSVTLLQCHVVTTTYHTVTVSHVTSLTCRMSQTACHTSTCRVSHCLVCHAQCSPLYIRPSRNLVILDSWTSVVSLVFQNTACVTTGPSIRWLV